MSKKHKTNPKINNVISNNTSKNKGIFSQLFGFQNGTNSTSLIVFEKKVNIFLALMFALFFIASFSKLHTSSVGLWDQYFGLPKSKSVIAGTPRGIRQDEWMLSVPNTIGQYKLGFPLSNKSNGDGNVPVMTGMPIKDYSMVLVPKLWPYFIFDIERAFAFSWNYSIIFFILTTFFLFMLLTGNNFWLSLVGSLFIFLSGAMQWWSYWLGAIMINLNLIVIALVYLLYSKNIKVLSIAAVILLISSYCFMVSLYPPWQIPLVYLYISILIGFVLKKNNFKAIKEKLWIRISIFSLVGIVLSFFVYHHYTLIKETTEIMMNTAYPGKRSTNGGDLISGKLFSEFFGIYMSDIHFPVQWLNICEASGFIMFFPIVFYVMGYNYFKTKNFDWQQLTITAYVVVLLIWVLVGFPSFLSKISLLSMSPVYRTLPVLGVANCILLVCFIGSKNPNQKTKFSWIELGILAVAIFTFISMVENNINTSTKEFFTSNQVSTVTLLIMVIYLLIRFKHIKYTQLVLAVILLGMTFQNVKIHPLTSGLSAVLENPLVKETKEISLKDPTARWAVFGDQHLSNLLKANGINVFNGVKTVPLLKDMALLDPTGKNNFIYNRFAHINLFYLIDMKDSIQFKLNENEVVNDNYSILMDPCSPRLKKLGIKYFLFTYKPMPLEIRNLILVKNISNLSIYKQSEL
jgi:hypothetical protein